LSAIPQGWYSVLNSLPPLSGEGSPWERPATIPGGCEIRLDLWQGPLPVELPPRMGPPIVTDRGGGSENDQARHRRRDQLCRISSGWLDVDPETDVPAPDDLPWILSRHLHTDSSGVIDKIVEEAKSRGAVAAKVVLPADTSLARRVQILEEVRTRSFPIVAFSNAEKNHADRLWARESGQPWGYAIDGDQNLNLPGIPSIDELHHRYQWREGDSPRHRFLVMGEDVRHSLSADWHNALFVERGISARFYPWSTTQPTEAIEGAAELSLKGLAVTAPFKNWARKLCAGITTDCERWPAWNTLAFENGGWRGTSTDGPGAADLLRPHLKAGKRAVILGRGGAAKSVAESFHQEGVYSTLLCRPGSPIAEEKTQQPFTVSADPDLIESADLLINATGSDPEKSYDWPWDLSRFQGAAVIEMDYSRGETAFEREFQSRDGVSVWSGTDFFAAQARHQARAFSGSEVSMEESLQRVRHCLHQRRTHRFPC